MKKVPYDVIQKEKKEPIKLHKDYEHFKFSLCFKKRKKYLYKKPYITFLFIFFLFLNGNICFVKYSNTMLYLNVREIIPACQGIT